MGDDLSETQRFLPTCWFFLFGAKINLDPLKLLL